MNKPKTDGVVIHGKMVICSHCGGSNFDQREVLMNTRSMTFMNLDWLNRGASALTCTTCGRIEWFSELPESLPIDSDDELKRRANEGSL